MYYIIRTCTEGRDTMYPLFLGCQFLGILILLIELIHIFRQYPSKQQMLLFAFVLAALLNSVGYFFEMCADTLDTALNSVKFTYLGKSYVLFLMLLFVMEYCKTRMPKWLIAGLTVIHTLIAVLVLTCEHHTLFYTSVTYTKSGLFPHLVLGYGFFYYVNIILAFAYMLTAPVVSILRYRKVQNTKERRQLIYMSCIFLVPAMGLFLYYAGITGGYDSTALSSVISSAFLFFAMFGDNLFETLTLAKDYVIENLTDGFIVLGQEQEILYSNQPACRLFPKLKTSDYRIAIEDIRRYHKNEQYIFHDEEVYSVTYKTIRQKETVLGHLFLLNNVTAAYNNMHHLEEDIQLKTQEIKRIQHSVITSFANLIEARDDVTGQHIKRTSAYVEIITRALKQSPKYREYLTEEQVSNIINAAPLHDIGKITVPDAILTKPGKLTAEEFEIIKTHSANGAHIISENLADVEHTDYLNIARDMAHYHHEKWDGSGYPCGLKGEQIPLCARIMAIADVYDALCSRRSYKSAFSKEKALAIITESSGKHFDPDIVNVFLENIDLIANI